MKGCAFEQDIAAVYDARLSTVVLRLGWWIDATGARVGAEVCTMAQPRQLHELLPLPGLAPALLPPSSSHRRSE